MVRGVRRGRGGLRRPRHRHRVVPRQRLSGRPHRRAQGAPALDAVAPSEADAALGCSTSRAARHPSSHGLDAAAADPVDGPTDRG
ncbi:hypothetical protein GS416_09655 [Rhodococcus hoagii]|nr:hypothetical protein [Prescottella equi]